MGKKSALIIVLLLPLVLFAQRRNRYKYEWTFAAGATNFLGEVGGANQTGTNFLKDFDFPATRPAIHVGFRKRTSRYTAAKAAMYAGILGGSDVNTTEPYRNNRNITFRTPFVELSAQFEAYIVKEKRGHLYRINNVKQPRRLNIQFYAFMGVSGLLFNPMGKYLDGSWHSLQPLGTEGQGLSGKKKYSRINVAFPIGVGFKYGIDRRWSVGLEYGIRYTLTDYLDDVSTTYYDNAEIQRNSGDIAAYLADPSLNDPEILAGNGGLDPAATGNQRGDPKDKDVYMMALVTVNYKILYRRKTRSKF